MNEIKTGVFTIKDNTDIFVVGDIHGDYQCLIHCLVDLCKVCSITKLYNDTEFNMEMREYLDWNENNNNIVVFCGDLIDRKRFSDHVLDDESSDIYILLTLLRLKKQAIKNNGDLIIISGNHEIMNITSVNENIYISEKNLKYNKKFFNDKNFINNYINNSYAWVKINDILITHGGLCSEYLKSIKHINLDKEHFCNCKNIESNTHGDCVIDFINNCYRNFFTNNTETLSVKEKELYFDLFIKYNISDLNTHNMFWCRQWGYGEIDCNNYNNVLETINCKKMIISHCPQFLSPDKPKMINFECQTKNNNLIKYKLARIDLGMSRSFDYNKFDKFNFYLKYNFNRKISILKLLNKDCELYFNYDSIITCKLSCLQYLFFKYGITKSKWLSKKINTNWIGFELIEKLITMINDDIINNDNIINNDDFIEFKSLLCLLYPVIINNNLNLPSVNQFNDKFK